MPGTPVAPLGQRPRSDKGKPVVRLGRKAMDPTVVGAARLPKREDPIKAEGPHVVQWQ